MSLNIPPHIPQVVVNASVPSTEALVRSNAVKEVVPAPVKTEANVPQKSRDQEARSPITEDVTYERVSPQNNKVIPEDPQNGEDREQGQSQSQEQESQDNAGGDDSSDITSAANAENRDETSQSDESKAVDEQERQQELREIQQLSARDMEVRNHELAHAAVGGSYAGAPSYEYQTGPDGKKYAVGGEVSIDVSKEATPQETIEKMQTVKAAALAPAEPSSQDRKVAAEASQNIAEARVELVRESEQERKDIAESVQNSFNDSDSDDTGYSVEGNTALYQNASSESGTDNASISAESAQLQKVSSVIAQRYNTSYVEETDPSSQFTAVA